ncbi:heme-binding protein [Trifolium repens]|nr:heme-binding protein [Trifolium repens]
METTLMCFLYYLFIAICYSFGNSVHAIESPKYVVIQTESDFEIRLYNESSWISAPSSGTNSFQQSTKTGFHRLYQYIHGANSNTSKLAITAPILTRIPSSISSESNPELKLQLEKWKTQCIAVRKFNGYAKDDNINKEIEALVSSLNKHLDGTSTIMQDTSSYTIAQYNASFHNTERVNEVWINVSGFTTDC